MSRLHKDVVIVGNELTGIAAGAQLAHRGLRVLLIDEGETDLHPLGDYLLPLAPSFWSIQEKGVNAELISELGLRQDLAQAFGPPSEVGLVADPDFRMSFPSENDLRRKELSRVFGPHDGPALADMFDSFAPPDRTALFEESTRIHERGLLTQFRARKRKGEAGDKIDPNKTVPEVENLLKTKMLSCLDAWAHLAIPLEHLNLEGYAAELALRHIKFGLCSNSKDGLGPREILRRLLIKVILGHGGEQLTGSQIVEVETRGNKVLCLKTNGQNDFIAGAVIDATSDSAFTSHLPESRALTKTRLYEQAIAPTGAATILRWVLDAKLLPRGLGACTLLLPSNDSKSQAPIAVNLIRNPQTVTPNQTKKTNGPLVGILAAARYEKEQDELMAAYIEQELQKLLPFSLNQAVAHDKIVGQRAWSSLPTFEPESDGTHQLLGRSPLTGFQNLFRAGQELAPCLGFDGELSTSRAIADGIARRLIPSS